MKVKSLHRQSGLNLIEILIAALILSIGLLSLSGLQVASMKSINNSTHKQQVAFFIHELFELMRSNRTAALQGDYVTTGISCTGAAPVDCSASAACTPSQVAQNDLYTIMCGNDSVAATDSGINEQLVNGSMAISCPTGDCAEGINVTVSWEERLTKQLDNDDTSNANSEVVSLSLDAVI